MSSADITKYVLSESLKELLKKMPFSKVSVRDITKQANVSRNAFYYHFRDKFELVTYIFHTEITPIISQISNVNSWSRGLLSLCYYMRENKDFYIAVLKEDGQNSFSSFLMEFYQNIILDMLYASQEKHSFGEFEVHIISRFYAHSLIGVLSDWVREGMKQDPSPVVEILEELINGAHSFES